MFLSDPLESGEAGRSTMRDPLGGANCSRDVCGARLPTTESPFGRLGWATALLWGRCHPRTSDVGPSLVPPREPCRFVIDLWARSYPGLSLERRGTFTGQCGDRCNEARPRSTLSADRANRNALGADQASQRLADASAGSGAWHSDKAEKWPLPARPCLAPPSPVIAGRRWLHRSSRTSSKVF